MKWILDEKDYIKEEAPPNLLRGIFPYSSVPKVTFDNKHVPINPPSDIWITDTTFRDGQQSRPPYTVEQIVDLYTFMHRLGGPDGVIRQSEFFLYTAKDKEAVNKCLEKGFKYPEVTGWIRAVKKDFQMVKDLGLKETGILTSASDYHLYLKLKKDRKQAMKDYLDVIDAALEVGVIPRCHLEDITRADFYGFVLPFVKKLMKMSKEAKIPVKVRACDTMGYGVPYPEASIPRSVPKLMNALVKEGGVPPEQLEWHGHNDFHKVLINATTAWLYGCCAANGTLLGFGERTGNPPLEGLIIEYIAMKGYLSGIDTTVITEIADYFREKLGVIIPPNYPFVGADFNTTSAGIHADGLIKNEEIYNIFDTNKILNRPMGVTITDKSGVAGISFWVNNHLNLKGDKKIRKDDAGITAIAKWVGLQFEEGRVSSISAEEMLEQARKNLPKYFESEFDKLKKKAESLAVHLINDLVLKKEIRSMKTTSQERVMQKTLNENPFIQFIYIVNNKGMQTTKNITHHEDAKKFKGVGTGEKFSDRIWFIKAKETGKAYVSNFYSSRFTDKLCITVSSPIKNDEGEMLGVLGIDIRFEDLAKL